MRNTSDGAAELGLGTAAYLGAAEYLDTAQYLDAAATAPLCPEALAAMQRVWGSGQANASSVHSFGSQARRELDHARAGIAAAFGVRGDEVVFTSGGTEANNLIIRGVALAAPRGRHLVTSAIEHASVLEVCAALERLHGFEVSLVQVDDAGRIDPADVAAVLRPDTTLVSVGLANAEVGTVQEIQEIAALAHSVGAVMHTDAVQAAPSLPVRLGWDAAAMADQRVPGWPGPAIDALTIASHKFGGPQGVGAAIVRSRLALEPLVYGGGQERGHRSGTENVAGIAGFAAAVRVTTATPGTRARDLMVARDLLVAGVIQQVPGIELTGHATERLPGHASFVLPAVSGEALLVALDAAGVSVSSGSACAAGQSEPSPVLLALGLSPEAAQTALRITLAEPISVEAIDRIVAIMRTEVTRLLGQRPVRPHAPAATPG